jgi:hypothetical protein
MRKLKGSLAGFLDFALLGMTVLSVSVRSALHAWKL